jgi:hypothetical protein
MAIKAPLDMATFAALFEKSWGELPKGLEGPFFFLVSRGHRPFKNTRVRAMAPEAGTRVRRLSCMPFAHRMASAASNPGVAWVYASARMAA